ncbi:hypothetical protein I4U23_015340 [Adineta vaga]|nr:hypothetical protein I4U23_015340 [Adineta vaga]
MNNTNRTFLYIKWGHGGFCSELNQLLLAFAYSVSTQRHFLIDSYAWNYGNFSDYFYLPSTNDYFQINRTHLVQSNEQNELVNHLKTTGVGMQLNLFWIASLEVQSIEKLRYVAHYLWKSISKETSEFIHRYKLNILSDYIGIHVRRGDKLIEEAREIPLSRYITSIESVLYNDTSIQSIFVASDDQSVVENLSQLKPAWKFMNIKRNKSQRISRFGHFQQNFNQQTQKEKLFETRLFLCELQMFIEAKYVICGMSSNVCRFIQILRHQHSSTVISLDKLWSVTYK